MDKLENITISLDHYTELIEAQDKLMALEDAGVDNWSGYDEAMQSIVPDK